MRGTRGKGNILLIPIVRWEVKADVNAAIGRHRNAFTDEAGSALPNHNFIYTGWYTANGEGAVLGGYSRPQTPGDHYHAVHIRVYVTIDLDDARSRKHDLAALAFLVISQIKRFRRRQRKYVVKERV